MKIIYFIGIFYILGCGTPGSVVRNDESPTPRSEDCMEFFRAENWQKALSCLENIPDSSRDQAYFDLKGSALMPTGQYNKAHLAFKNAIAKDVSGNNPFLFFKYGKALWYDHQFLESGKAMKTFLEIVDNPRPSVKKQADYYLRSAETAHNLYQYPRQFNPLPLSDSINTNSDELGISLTYDRRQLILTRRTSQEDLYHSHLRNEKWRNAIPMPTLNTPDNEGAAALSGDGELLVFTACQRPYGVGSCDLYFSSLQDTGWSTPVLVPVVNSRFWDSQPSLSPDGKVLIFSSTRPGGQGGKDLWLSVQSEAGWIEPLNLGPSINTPGNEENPFLHTDEYTLYFTSDYWPGFGGRDLFMAHRIRGNEWSEAQNLGYPINSFQDEEGIFIESSGQTGYFSSSREGQFDLYRFEVDSVIQPRPSLLYQMVVTDSVNGQPIKNAAIMVYNWTDDKMVRTATTDDEGYVAFLIAGGQDYGITVSHENYQFYSFREQMKANLKTDVTDTILLAPIRNSRTLVLENVHFASGEARLLKASEVELNHLAGYLHDNPNLHIILTGHTDNVGGKDDNLMLSRARAEAVMSYLVRQKVAPERIKAQGMGESKPVASNQTPEGRQQNRRTEITIIEQ